MLKATNTNVTVSANGTIPLILKRNTFPYVSLNNNVITIHKAGIYQIIATINATATTTDENVGLYNNNVLIPETEVEIDATSGDVYQMVINDIETVVATLPITDKVNLAFKTTSGLVVDTINVSVIELR